MGSQLQLDAKPARSSRGRNTSLDPSARFVPSPACSAAIGRFFDRVFGPLWRFLENHVFHPVSAPLSSVFGDWWPLLVLAVAVVAGVLVGRIIIRRRALPGREAASRISQTCRRRP